MKSTDKTKNTFAITTPLYYVNDLPHVGSAYTTMAADALARFERLRGKSVLLVTGTDEHGQKIQRTAESLGQSPQAHCDSVVPAFEALWEQLTSSPIASSAQLRGATSTLSKNFSSASGTPATST